MNELELNLRDADGDLTPLGDLIDKAAELFVTTPDINDISRLSQNSAAFVRDLRDHPAWKLFLLVLRVERAVLSNDAANAVSDGRSNEEIRALLTKQKTIDTLIRYVNQTSGPFESGGRIRW